MVISFESVVLISSVIAVAASVQGITGFGFNLLAVPILILFFPPHLVVPGVLMAYVPLGLTQTFQLRRSIDFRIWASFVGSAVVALPLGAYILGEADVKTMRMGIGSVMIFLALLLQFRPGLPFRRDFLSRILTGLLSGVLSGSTGVSGPPLVLLGLKQHWPYTAFRATLIAYFTMVSILTIPFHWRIGLVTPQTVQFAGSALPGLLVGFFLGAHLRSRVDASVFRWVALAMVIVGGLSAIVF